MIQIGPDPLFQRVPVRNFRSDITIASETSVGLCALEAAMRPHLDAAKDIRTERRCVIEGRTAASRRSHAEIVDATLSKARVARCLSDAIAGRDVTVLSELGCPLDGLVLGRHNSWRQEPHSGGLGWSFPSALGMQLADRDRLIVATMGDGSYIFSNPVACHQIAEALALPVLVVILNNGGYDAVEKSVLGLYPAGHAAAANRVPLTSIAPVPDFTKVAAASRGYAVRVDRAADLPAALRDAIAHVTTRRQQALVEVILG